MSHYQRLKPAASSVQVSRKEANHVISFLKAKPATLFSCTGTSQMQTYDGRLMCWGSVKRRKGLPSSSRYSLSPADLRRLPTPSPYPLPSINSPSPSSSSCWSWVQCGASLGCISQEEQTFPRVGSVKFCDKTCVSK